MLKLRGKEIIFPHAVFICYQRRNPGEFSLGSFYSVFREIAQYICNINRRRRNMNTTSIQYDHYNTATVWDSDIFFDIGHGEIRVKSLIFRELLDHWGGKNLLNCRHLWKLTLWYCNKFVGEKSIIHYCHRFFNEKKMGFDSLYQYIYQWFHYLPLMPFHIIHI